MGIERSNDLLRAAREKRGWTQAEVAEKIGTTSVNVSRWENGITFPSRFYRQKLGTLFGISASELGLTRESGEQDIPGAAAAVFLFNEPLPAPGELYARQRERKTLLSRTIRKASTSIVGPRRIGKTWLMHYLRLVAPEQLGSRFRIGYLDAMSPKCRTVNGFVSEALTSLGYQFLTSLRGSRLLITVYKRYLRRNSFLSSASTNLNVSAAGRSFLLIFSRDCVRWRERLTSF